MKDVQKKASPYLGTIEITQDGITLNPEPRSRASRRYILWDFVSQTANGHPWHIVGVPHDPEPAQMLAAVTRGIFQQLIEDGDAGQAQPPVGEVLVENSCTGAQYAIGITPIPGTPLRFCDVWLLASRSGTTWHDLDGIPLTEEERAVAARLALHNIETTDRRPA